MKPLFILPFDHRGGITHELFGVAYPPNAAIAKKIIALKKVIFAGFLKAYPGVKKFGDCGILVDEEFGDEILKQAKAMGIIHILTTENSGATGFSFAHGKGFGRAILKRDPTYAKALLNYNMGDKELNGEKMEKVKELSDFCLAEGVPLMLEPLLHGKQSPLAMATTMMNDLHKHGIRPAVWKLEMQRTAKDWRKLEKIAKAPMVLLGHGESKAMVEEWVITAAKSGAVNGFAIGRTVFFEPIKKLNEKKITKEKATELIAKNYTHFVKLWVKNAK